MAKSFQVFVEINAGSATKYEMDEKTGRLFVNRFLKKPFVYPFDYGFIKGSRARDGDPLDAVVLSSERLDPGTEITCRAIGVLDMEDQAGEDPKIIVVPLSNVDPGDKKYKTIQDVPDYTLDSIKYFFANYKTGEAGRWSKVGGFRGEKEANLLVSQSLKEKDNG